MKIIKPILRFLRKILRVLLHFLHHLPFKYFKPYRLICKKLHNKKIKLWIKLANKIEKYDYRGGYWISVLRFRIELIKKKITGKKITPKFDIIFVVPPKSQGWILEAIAKEIAQHVTKEWAFAEDLTNLPRAKSYYFCHYALLPMAYKRNPHIWSAVRSVYYTHPRTFGHITQEEVRYSLDCTNKVMSMCSEFANQLIHWGIRQDRVCHILAGADPEMFKPHERGNGAVGISTAYYERKNPDRILRLVKAMPHRNFILLGKRWKDEYPRYSELEACSNFEYIEDSYENYPKHYARMDVFLSPADLEGGPIPLIETMMCNIVPVATKTGFSKDIVYHGKNGYLFDIESSEEKLTSIIDQAFQHSGDIRQSAVHLSWENFSKIVQNYLGLLN